MDGRIDDLIQASEVAQIEIAVHDAAAAVVAVAAVAVETWCDVEATPWSKIELQQRCAVKVPNGRELCFFFVKCVSRNFMGSAGHK